MTKTLLSIDQGFYDAANALASMFGHESNATVGLSPASPKGPEGVSPLSKFLPEN